MICMPRWLLALTLLSFLSACSDFSRLRVHRAVALAPYPESESKDYWDERALRAPKDWTQLAHDAAFRVLQRASQAKELTNKPIFVAPPTKQTPFELAMYQFLQSGLTEMGITVSQRAEDAIRLDYIVQPVRSDWGMDVMITTAISNGFRYLFRHSDVYQVNAVDAALYDASFLQVIPPTPIPSKKITVTGDSK